MTHQTRGNDVYSVREPKFIVSKIRFVLTWEPKVPPPKATPPSINKALLRDY